MHYSFLEIYFHCLGSLLYSSLETTTQNNWRIKIFLSFVKLIWISWRFIFMNYSLLREGFIWARVVGMQITFKAKSTAETSSQGMMYPEFHLKSIMCPMNFSSFPFLYTRYTCISIYAYVRYMYICIYVPFDIENLHLYSHSITLDW